MRRDWVIPGLAFLVMRGLLHLTLALSCYYRLGHAIGAARTKSNKTTKSNNVTFDMSNFHNDSGGGTLTYNLRTHKNNTYYNNQAQYNYSA